jgi:hypothetical protein
MNGNKEDSHPGFLSPEFHLRFFPRLLLKRTDPQEQRKTGFHSTLELYIILSVCIILVISGSPAAINRGSIAGWIVGGIGAAGIIAMCISSIAWGIKTRPAYDAFLKGIFFLFLVLGLSAGVFTGTLEHSLLKGLTVGAAGVIAGYLLGIMAGLWLQYLGWLADILNMLAFLAVFGMLFVDIVILGGSIF